MKKKIKAVFEKQIIEGEIIEIRRSRSIETEDNPDPVKVLLYRIKTDKPFFMRMWDDRLKSVTMAWVDSNSIIV